MLDDDAAPRLQSVPQCFEPAHLGLSIGVNPINGRVDRQRWLGVSPVGDQHYYIGSKGMQS